MNATTAQLRNAAREAAAACKWQHAAELMALAIERHPGNRNSPMVQHDLAIMGRTLAGFRTQLEG
jgi:hypothetical protein